MLEAREKGFVVFWKVISFQIYQGIWVHQIAQPYEIRVSVGYSGY